MYQQQKNLKIKHNVEKVMFSAQRGMSTSTVYAATKLFLLRPRKMTLVQSTFYRQWDKNSILHMVRNTCLTVSLNLEIAMYSDRV